MNKKNPIALVQNEAKAKKEELSQEMQDENVEIDRHVFPLVNVVLKRIGDFGNAPLQGMSSPSLTQADKAKNSGIFEPLVQGIIDDIKDSEVQACNVEYMFSLVIQVIVNATQAVNHRKDLALGDVIRARFGGKKADEHTFKELDAIIEKEVVTKKDESVIE